MVSNISNLNCGVRVLRAYVCWYDHMSNKDIKSSYSLQFQANCALKSFPDRHAARLPRDQQAADAMWRNRYAANLSVRMWGKCEANTQKQQTEICRKKACVRALCTGVLVHAQQLRKQTCARSVVSAARSCSVSCIARSCSARNVSATWSFNC